MARGLAPVRLRSNRKTVTADSFRIAEAGFRGASHPNGAMRRSDKPPRHTSSHPQYLQRFDGDDFHVKGQRFARQRVVEVDGHLRVIELFHHARQFSIGRIVEDHQQAR